MGSILRAHVRGPYIYVATAIFHSCVVYGFSNKDYGYCTSTPRPLDGIILQAVTKGKGFDCDIISPMYH